MRNKSKHWRLISGLLLTILCACQALPTVLSEVSPPTQQLAENLPPTPRPTPVLEPARDYQSGHCQVSEDQYLFLRYSSHSSCSKACDCPAVEALQPAINRDGDQIIYNHDQVVGKLLPGDPSSRELGLISYGWFEEEIFVIDATPFEIPRSRVSLLGCEGTGTLIVDLYGQVYYLHPGENWFIQNVVDEGGGCHMIYTVSLTNSGLMPRNSFQSDISVRDEYVHLELAKRTFSIEEDISFTVRLIGEEGIDYSGFCMFTFEVHEDRSWKTAGDCSSVPDYVPEPYPRQPGEIIEVQLPTSTIGLNYIYQYELSPGTYRLKFTYGYSGGTGVLVSPYFTVIEN